MRILFIVENGIQESLAIATLASSIRQYNHETDMVLFSHTPNLYDYIQQTKPDIIGFSIITGSHKFAYELGRKIRVSTGIPIIAGGPHATFYSQHLADSGTFDYICRGEGEEPLSNLLNNLEDGKSGHRIPGIWANQDNVWYKNDVGPTVENLDARPIPDRSLFFKYKFLRNMTLKRFVTGVGCPYPCTFCHSINFMRETSGKGKFMRSKSPEYMICEIKSVQKLAPLRNIHFSDDTFGLNIEWLEEFVNLYKEEIALPFTCNARADTPFRVIELFKEGGCIGVQIGLESGSERIRRKLLKKMWLDETAVEVCHAFRKSGMKVMATNMIGIPSETLEEAWSTIELNVKCKIDYARCNVFLPHPALDLTKWAIKNGYIKEGFSLEDFSAEALNPVVKTPFRKEFVNIANLFSLSVKHKLLRKLIKRVCHLRPNAFFNFIGSLNMFQDFFFFQLKVMPSYHYFRNTIGSPIGFKYGAWPTDKVKKV
jgi:anaerobic magnesium-protoporphyrin IX monomethyl ester cyclase